MTYVDEYRAALVDRQLAAIDATPPMPRPWLPCSTCGQDPRVHDCDGTPPQPEYLSGDAAAVVAGRNYPKGP